MKYLLIALIYPLSYLPMPVLHFFSSCLQFWVYTVCGYRKKVVRENIQKAFPAKSFDEIVRVEKAFYLHLCDLIFESIKTFTISREELKRRFVFKTPEVTERLASKSLTGISSHYGNWEWNALALAMEFKQISFGVYKPLNSKVWDQLFFDSRCRFGIRMIPIKMVREVMDTYLNQPIMMGLLSDQAPHNYEKAFDVTFMGVSTYVTPGPAVITVQRKYAPIWGWVRKVGRSRYEWGLEEIELTDMALIDAAKDLKQVDRISRVHSLTPEQAAYALALTRDFSARLEREIKMAPEFWLWSHRRWKSR
ncbi:MAG: hypothetical protein JST80_09960 [Bdellovibrionales bacterium]|nr:hypothetical protein [Bdellovibrionales bacterium]